MPPRKFSRHTFTIGGYDAANRLLLTDAKPFAFKPYADNIQHTVKEGDTLFTIAGLHFAPKERACGFWKIIADYQPIPIHDPTLKLEVGRVLFVPSLRTLEEEILSEKRRREPA
jgi:hypothetical protein